MEYVQGREGYYEEEDEEMAGERGKHPFSSSSSSSPSYCQYKSLIPQPNWTYDPGMLNFHGQDLRRQESDGGETSGAGVGCVEKEHMFDKVVTPSDVGKLNRLVIPKQHAEKYFPLDSSANEKGLLLNFEDRGGKPWRFRYSYWNSSQSYVMTKGWSRFVKEKKLDAGDIVSFERGVGELGKDRLFIDWSRRPDAPDRSTMPNLAHLPHTFSFPLARSVPWGRFFMPPTAMSVPERDYMHLQQMNYDNFHHQRISYSGGSYGYNVVNPSQGPVIHLRSITPQQVGRVEEGVDHVPMVFDSVPVVQGKAAAKRVRLFGVNLDCPIQEDPECDILSSTTISHSAMVSLSSSSHLLPSPPPPSSSSSSLPHLQLRLFNGSPLPPEFPKQGKSSMSFNLDI